MLVEKKPRVGKRLEHISSWPCGLTLCCSITLTHASGKASVVKTKSQTLRNQILASEWGIMSVKKHRKK